MTNVRTKVGVRFGETNITHILRHGGRPGYPRECAPLEGGAIAAYEAAHNLA